MSGVRARFFVMTISLGLALPSIADGHRLDEYLQATRIDVSLDRVALNIDLTAGVGVAPGVWRLIDTDRNGHVSDAEGRSYADLVLKSVVLQVDGQVRPVALVASHFPTFQEITSGSGPIRIEARAELPLASGGRHTLRYRNTHRRATSVYLVNTLVPSSSAITIASQRRDRRQTELVLTYDVARAP
jgi:hypothetical protein